MKPGALAEHRLPDLVLARTINPFELRLIARGNKLLSPVPPCCDDRHPISTPAEHLRVTLPRVAPGQEIVEHEVLETDATRLGPVAAPASWRVSRSRPLCR